MSMSAATAVLGVRDTALTVAERYVLLVYAVHARQPDDPESPLEAWPTANTVAAETGLTREHVQRSLAVLQQRGLLRQTGRKRGRANVYQVSLRRISVLCGQITPTCDVTSQQPVMSDHTERTVERTGERTPLLVPAAEHQPEAFAEFWSVYPRKVAKGAAERAWGRAIKRAEPSLIVAGAVRYRDDPTRTPKFTAHPATWLNGARWEDESPAGMPDERQAMYEAWDRNAEMIDNGNIVPLKGITR